MADQSGFERTDLYFTVLRSRMFQSTHHVKSSVRLFNPPPSPRKREKICHDNTGEMSMNNLQTKINFYTPVIFNRCKYVTDLFNIIIWVSI